MSLARSILESVNKSPKNEAWDGRREFMITGARRASDRIEALIKYLHRAEELKTSDLKEFFVLLDKDIDYLKSFI